MSRADYNNNPGNIRPPNGVTYEGQIGVDDKGFAVFQKPEFGRKALVNDIQTKIKNGLNNPNDFIDRYSPAGDNTEDARNNYKIHLAEQLGLKSTKDPFPKDSHEKLANAIASFESGNFGEQNTEQPPEPPGTTASAAGEPKTSPKPPEPPVTQLPTGLATLAGAGAGTTVGSALGTGAAGLQLKADIARAVTSYPEAVAALKAGKSPAEVMEMVLKGKAAANLPTAQGPLTGEPAGGYQTQNWVASGDTQGRYTDVGLNARDKAEAHQMKLRAMEAEDKIRKIAPEMRPNPNRANLFLPESAGKGPSPRFGGTPNVPIPPVAAPVAEAPSMLRTAANYAKGYLPFLKYPALGALTGANVAHGIADVYNRVHQKLPGEATASGLGTLAGTVAPFVGGVASPLLAGGALATQLMLSAQDRDRYLKKHPEEFMLETSDVDPMGNRIR
jgi:hypothetical protein